MKQSDRFEFIINMVQKNKKVTVSELSSILGFSEITIRNDIRTLDEQGVIERVHGGAIFKEDGLQVSFAPGEFFLNAESKTKIAIHAYDLIKDNYSIILDDSTSSGYLARVISEQVDKSLTVITNSLYNATILYSCPHINLIIIGGQVVGNPPIMVDSFSVNHFRSFNVDLSFIGVDGINFDTGITSIAKPQMDTKRSIIESSRSIVVLADYTKFNNRNLFVVAPLTNIDMIITDKRFTNGIPSELVKKIVIV